MTEKRFIRNIIGQVYDSENDKFFEEDYGGKPIGYEDDLVVCLNVLHEEKTRLYEDNIRIKQLITTSFNNERTELGRNVIQQIIEQL